MFFDELSDGFSFNSPIKNDSVVSCRKANVNLKTLSSIILSILALEVCFATLVTWGGTIINL